jgi:hypothetical protein
VFDSQIIEINWIIGAVAPARGTQASVDSSTRFSGWGSLGALLLFWRYARYAEAKNNLLAFLSQNWKRHMASRTLPTLEK